MNSTDAWLSRTAEKCSVVAKEIDAEREYRSYLQTAFNGGNEDWVQWIPEQNKDELLGKIQRAIWRLPADEALLEIQLLLSVEITKAAKGHVDQCSRNGTL